MKAAKIISICKDTNCDALHPGYGFLSENAEFVDLLSQAGILFVGPTASILRDTGDKTSARALAIRNNVPVLPASPNSFTEVNEARTFIVNVGFPIMIKAVDGGGGRGIRLVEQAGDFDSAFSRACGESPSQSVFIEKAAVIGFRHVEVQILGDERGNVAHLWERECSIQRRFQKVIELAPSTIVDRSVVANVIACAVRLAKSIRYRSLGTFEFLVHESSGEYYFLEVNPRLQVEHTITEEISGIDIVRLQLLLAQGATIDSLELPSRHTFDATTLRSCAIQLRVTAEDAKKGFQLSMGKVTQARLPGGNGVRVDTHLSSLSNTQIGASYDSLLAKVIVRGSSLESARMKALRALKDVHIVGVQTNLPALFGVLASKDFAQNRCATLWLEANIADVLESGSSIIENNKALSSSHMQPDPEEPSAVVGGLGAASMRFKKGDGFEVTLKEKDSPTSTTENCLLKLDRVRINDFPNTFAADVTFQSSLKGTKTYAMTVAASTLTGVASSSHRTGDPSDPSHVCLPFSGELMEIAVQSGDSVRENDLLCVVRQMKMELEVRAPYDAVITWAFESEEGEVVNEGLLVCILQRPDTSTRPPNEAVELYAKL